jgi:hypothetical protein
MTHLTVDTATRIIATEYDQLREAIALLSRRLGAVPASLGPQFRWLAQAERRVLGACAAAQAGGPRAEVVYAADALLDALGETTAVVAAAARP